MEAYCFKCKAKREMIEPQAVYTVSGGAGTTGTCSVCGGKMFKMGTTEAHAGLPRPDKVERPARKAKAGGKGAKNAGGARRSGKLVIVESPTKAKTVGRFLGKGYTVRASVGHVRDLLKSTLSVDVDNDFAPKYRVPNEKRLLVKELKAEAAKAEEIFLATDPDREGESISWHLLEAAEIDPARTKRVVFHEITKPAIEEAFRHPRDIAMDLVNAQQARRILDRLVGYSLSPLLWAKVRGRLSAGRVQSVAVKLIVDREREINAFVPREYWTVDAELKKTMVDGTAARPFRARLVRIGEREVGSGEDSILKTQRDVDRILGDLERSAYAVSKIKTGERRRSPSAPYTTSTLQQEASRRLGFTAKRTMATAQQLYEGIELGEGQAVGLITYMRTDSPTVSEIAQREAREFIGERYGVDHLPPEPPVYKARSKGAQEAHEAIRPTQVVREPKQVAPFLSKDQAKLYTLIWQRFVASQMAPALYDTLSVEITATPGGAAPVYLFRVSGATLRFPGFLAVYEEAKEDDAVPDEEAETRVPLLSVDEVLGLVKLWPEQHFTQPPPRYTEASLIKALEEYGIGRPSTYSPTITTIQQRGYVVREDKRLYPTDIGSTVNDLLVMYFPDIVDVGFTARMEDELDDVADGQRQWTGVLHEFWEPFSEKVKIAEAEMPEVSKEPELVGRECPSCDKPERPLVIRYGRYGKFIGCKNFPDCRHTEPWLEKIGVACNKCADGDMVERKTRKGRTFFGCSNYPGCEFTTWKRPLPVACANCGGMLVTANKSTAQCLDCQSEYQLSELALPA